jgi:hypothetical protein
MRVRGTAALHVHACSALVIVVDGEAVEPDLPSYAQAVVACGLKDVATVAQSLQVANCVGATARDGNDVVEFRPNANATFRHAVHAQGRETKLLLS